MHFAIFLSWCILLRMKRERNDKISELERQIATVEQKLESANEKARRYNARLQELRGKLLNRRLEAQLPLGRSSKKNQKKQLVWSSVREILSEPARLSGLACDALFREILKGYPRTNIVTFRAYLREFSDRQLLVKNDGRFQLNDVVRSNDP
jgi:seryl-tRNA synthetase